jgi:hypothetical protein
MTTKPSNEIPFNVIWPCASCGSDWEGPIEALPATGAWRGEFGTAFYITELRQTTGGRSPIIERMYSTAYYKSGVMTPNENYPIAVYSRPGAQQAVRGHAAYIGFPAEWFDHDKMKTMIRTLLEKFGEEPQ